ncbi:MAG: stage II sporulation protein M [Verrucomicrobia bacterium]|nr:stage II sporulation protein M [Verrucomicrobiota bacterium]
MTPKQFENDHGPSWQRLEGMIEQVEKAKPVANVDELPKLFRQACHDLSLAQHRMFGRAIVERLNTLAISGFRVLERRSSGGWERLWQMMMQDFPRAVRAESRLFWFCSAVFWLPFFAFLIITPFDPEWTMSMLGTEGMISMEGMYGEGTNPREYMRGEYGSDFGMFAFYIWNNVSINLRTFAGGLLGGVGSLVILLFNGAYFGSAAAYVNHACNPETFYCFVIGHGAPELLGIVISGMAGMRLGLSFVKPGAYDRKTALVLGGRKAMILITGAALMTAFAAIIEGFWSATPMEPWIKYTFGGCMWTATICYLLLCGRERHEA